MSVAKFISTCPEPFLTPRIAWMSSDVCTCAVTSAPVVSTAKYGAKLIVFGETDTVVNS